MRKGKNQVSTPRTVEVKVDVPVTKSGFMSIVLALLLALICYSGYLGVTSIWKFTHPQFNISLDSFKSLAYIAKGVKIPPIAGPTASQGYDISEEKTSSYLKSMYDFKNEFRQKHFNSKLLLIPDTDLLNIGWSLCKQKDAAKSNNGSFSQTEATFALKAKFILRYWQIDGLSEFLDGVAANAYQNLCGDN